MDSAVLEAETDTAEEEAAAALAEEEAARDAANAETARLAEEAAATGMTQAEREASAGFEPDAEAEAKPATKRKPRTRTPAQGNLAGGWETLIGGALPNEHKVKISGGSVTPDNKPETILVESRHRIVIDVIAVEHKVRAKLDKATGNVSNTGLTNTLEIVGATFLDPDEYVTRDQPDTE